MNALTIRSSAQVLMALCFCIAGGTFCAAEPSVPEPAPNTKMAVKLAGLVTFVASSCPDLQTDYQRFRAALGALGVSTVDLEKPELKGRYISYTLRYKEDVANNCARALKEFGPGGLVVSDLVSLKAKPAK